MAHLKLLLLWIGITVSTGIDLHKRIYGGQRCPKKEHLHHVKITTENRTHGSLCGGSLIHEQWVLTAAHCWEPGWDVYAFLGIHPHRLQRKRLEVTSGVFFQDNTLRHDIMLLKLSRPSKITPVALPDCLHPPNIGDVVQVAGLGYYRIYNDGTTRPGNPFHLRCAKMHVVACGSSSANQHVPHGNRLCLKEPQVDTCQGDSGGGVIYNNMIYGVHSSSGENVCTAPAVSLKVCSYLDWINQNIGT